MMRKPSFSKWSLLAIWLFVVLLNLALGIAIPDERIIRTAFWAYLPFVELSSGIMIAFTALAVAALVGGLGANSTTRIARRATSSLIVLVGSTVAVGILSFIWRFIWQSPKLQVVHLVGTLFGFCAMALMLLLYLAPAMASVSDRKPMDAVLTSIKFVASYQGFIFLLKAFALGLAITYGLNLLLTKCGFQGFIIKPRLLAASISQGTVALIVAVAMLRRFGQEAAEAYQTE